MELISQRALIHLHVVPVEALRGTIIKPNAASADFLETNSYIRSSRTITTRVKFLGRSIDNTAKLYWGKMETGKLIINVIKGNHGNDKAFDAEDKQVSFIFFRYCRV